MRIDTENENVRLDRFLKNNCKNNSLSEIFKAIRTGKVKVNGKKTRENYRLKLDDEIEINDLDFKEKQKKIANNNYKHLIFYENDDIMIVNKPAGIPMYKGTGNKQGLAEILNVDFSNRLDKKTSGLVIACKNKKSIRHITQLIRESKIIKEYIAITKNNAMYDLGDIFEIDKEIDGKKSKTIFELIEKTDKEYKFKVRLLTGRKHQIRIHLASINLAIIGDDKYGNYKKEDELKLKCVRLAFDGYDFRI